MPIPSQCHLWKNVPVVPPGSANYPSHAALWVISKTC